jgi:hypothetical protein
MMFVLVERGEPGYAKRLFGCRECERSETVVAQING